MSSQEHIQLFGDKKIRTVWKEDEEKWYFSIIDIVEALTDSASSEAASNYWRVLKHRLIKEGNESVTNCNKLKLVSPKDGKRYPTDVADQEQMFRLIQSIPSKKAEPIKQWIAKVASERIDETIDPEIAIIRAVDTYRRKGYSDEWIKERIFEIRDRKDLTDEWKRVGVKDDEYGILTNEIYKAWSDMTAKQYKAHKGLKKENLRDNMTATENALTRLGEVATRELSQNEDPKTFEHSQNIAKRGGGVARAARNELEKQLGHSVISKENAKTLRSPHNPKQIDDQSEQS
ncbi:MAG: Bro-N domain-containing protein [Bacteroidales bacterium]|nr:Bro-N domain-containing protein [Bacteroidales bacterium]